MSGGTKELVIRTISGIVFVALMVVAILYSAPLFVILFSIILLGCLWEFFKLRGSDKNFPLTILFSLYILPAFILSFFILKYFGPKVLLSLFIIMWAGDVGAYCIGTLFGQGPHGHKLAPKISPKKSWEGVIGGMLFAIAAAFVLKRAGWFNCFTIEGSQTGTIAAYVLFAIIFYAAAICGDLLESVLKRRAGVKDSGHIMPGHGGFLDRFDSFLTAIPVAYVLIELANIFIK